MAKKDDNPSSETSLESLESLGEALRQQREKRQLALQDCAELLKIRHRYLDSLEQGRPDDLPGDVFYINFVKSYANTIGLDGEDFASKARKILQKQGRMLELQSVMQHLPMKKAALRQGQSQGNLENTPDLTLKLASNLTTSLGQGEASRVSSLSAPSNFAPLPFSSEGSFPSQSITNSDTEKQLLRETLMSPLVVVGGLIGIVLLYLGAVIVLDLLGEGDSDSASDSASVSTETSILTEADEEQPIEETLYEVVEDARAPRIYGALGSARIEVWAKETCWIAVFATDTSFGKREQAEMLFAETLLEGDRYRVPAELGIILKGGNLSCLTFAVQGIVINPFRIPNPSGFISLEPSHLRARTAVREGGILARERLPVVLEIELLRQQRAERALELEGGNP